MPAWSRWLLRAETRLSCIIYRCHQQYLHKVPGGYCGIGGTGVSCPTGVARADS
jgi:peptide-methionine (S)-S-oxide reductase